MSFKLFIYYCAICGGWAAFVGWSLGHFLAPEEAFKKTLTIGMSLGLFVALALGVVDAVWNGSGVFGMGLQVFVAVAGGCLGGMVSAGMAQALVDVLPSGIVTNIFSVFGWTIVGLTIGGSVGVYELLARFAKGEGAGGAVRKIRNGMLGGAVGGMVGGGMHQFLGLTLGQFLPQDKTLMTPAAAGFIALGLSIGLMIGLAQVILKEAWLRVEAGHRVGREIILSKDEITIGRAESCDIGLFGDMRVDRTHARIQRKGTNYLLEDTGSADGTYLNEEKISAPTLLRSGDRILVGKNVLSFGERQKKVAPKR